MKKTFRNRIELIMILFALIPALILMTTIIVHDSSTRRGEALREAQKTVDTLAGDITEMNIRIRNTAQLLSSNGTLIDLSRQLRRGATIYEELDAYGDVTELLTLVKTNDEVENIRLYFPEGKIITHQRSTIFSMDELPESVRATGIENRGVSSAWVVDGDQIIYCVKSTYSRLSTFIVTAEVSQKYLRERIDRAGLTGMVSLYAGDTLLYGGTESGGVELEQTAGDWRLCCRLSMTQYEKGELFPVLMTILTCAAVLFLIPMLAHYFSKPISRDLNELVRANEDLGMQVYTRIDALSDIDEIRRLQESHNAMVDSTRVLIHDVYTAEHERDQAEITNLFEQIKPHFLYNTLEGGRWLALSEGATQTAGFMETLAQLYRIGLSQGKEFISIGQELEHVHQYVKLMNMRYSDNIHLAVQVDEQLDTERVGILRLILQPLVENAIEHGLDCGSREGNITIRVTDEQSSIRVTVSDNGTGIPEEELEKINNGTGGYALYNINRRLHLYCGEGSGMFAERLPEGGTRMTIIVPKQDVLY